jgi:hypothetical protein
MGRYWTELALGASSQAVGDIVPQFGQLQAH